jgi:hypothetical protein
MSLKEKKARNLRITIDCVSGATPGKLARKYEISSSRVIQIRNKMIRQVAQQAHNRTGQGTVGEAFPIPQERAAIILEELEKVCT